MRLLSLATVPAVNESLSFALVTLVATDLNSNLDFRNPQFEIRNSKSSSLSPLLFAFRLWCRPQNEAGAFRP
jgi:hypothetical protein